MKVLTLAGVILVIAIISFSWRSNRRSVLVLLEFALLAVAGMIYFSPTDLYIRALDLKDATAYFYFRDTPLPEDGLLVLKIAPKKEFYFSNEVVLQSGYNWHGELDLEVRALEDGAFEIKESHRPTKWRISSSGEVSKVQ